MFDSDLKKALLATRPFKYLVIDELESLIKYCKSLTFSKGEILFHQGKKSDRMYIIIHGSARVTAKILGQDNINFATLEQGNFIGEVSLIEKQSCTATVIAEIPTQCLELTADYFDMLSVFFPEIHYKITKAITEEVVCRINELYRKIILMMKDSTMEKKSIFSKLSRLQMKPDIINANEARLDFQHLKNTTFFKFLTPSDYAEMIEHLTLMKTPCHCPLIQENDKNAPYFFILRGAVQSSIIENNKVAKLSVLGPLSLFGSIELIDQSPSIISYTACERTLLFSISTTNLVRLQNNTTLWHKFFYEVCKSFVALERAADKLLIRLNSEIYNR